MAIVGNKTEPKMTINSDKMEEKLIHKNLGLGYKHKIIFHILL